MKQNLTKEDIKRMAEELRDVMSEEYIEELSDRRKKRSGRSNKSESNTADANVLDDKMR